MEWSGGELARASIRSLLGNRCRVRAAVKLGVTVDGKPVATTNPEPGVIEFPTTAGATYVLRP